MKRARLPVRRRVGQLRRLTGSRIPLTTREELSRLLAAGDDAFHRRQVAATYEHAAVLRPGAAASISGGQLPRRQARLRTSKPLTICLTGDSISEGYNASGFVAVPPFQPAYGALVAAGLEQAFGGPVTFHNLAVAGWTSDHGRADAARVAAPKPDLVIVAYGMNDACYADAGSFGANIDGNRERDPQLFAGRRVRAGLADAADARMRLRDPGSFSCLSRCACEPVGPGRALADMTTLWLELLKRKSPYDLSGNGLNHPNDFGHRLYAQTILAFWTRLTL